MFCLLGSDTEQHFDVAAQMIDAVCGDLCSARCLGEDEGALDDGLCVQRERFRRPIGCHVPLAHRRFDIGFQRCGMACDAAFAGFADGRRGLEFFVNPDPRQSAILVMGIFFQRLDLHRLFLHGASMKRVTTKSRPSVLVVPFVDIYMFFSVLCSLRPAFHRFPYS
jgi:hypothetical protein